MKFLILLTIAQFFLTSCAFGLKYIDKSKKTSSAWEPVAEDSTISKVDSPKKTKKKLK